MTRKVVLTRPERGVREHPAGPTGVVPPLKGGNNHPRAPDENGEKKPVADLLAAASSLSAADRRELLARLSLAEQQGRPGSSREQEQWAQAVHEALLAAAGAGAGAVPAPGVVRGLVTAPKAWAPVRDFMHAAGLADRLKSGESLKFFRLLARLLVEDTEDFCHAARVPFGPKLVAQRAERIGGVFDQAFPGYVRSGLAHVVAFAAPRAP